MRRNGEERGNIILTALFIAIFLFFLSVALIVTNKQDISLSLSMEHKLKAQTAARSVAMEAYGQLRQNGEIKTSLGSYLPEGIKANVELVLTEPIETNVRRGKVLLLKARATAGPVTSYCTMHLQVTELATVDDGPPKAIFAPTGEDGSVLINSNFDFQTLGQALPAGMVAGGGPIFVKSQTETASQPAFKDYLPVFSSVDPELKAVGPALVLAPAAAGETALQWLDYNYTDGRFEWKDIAPPGNLDAEEIDPKTVTMAYDLIAGGEGWTNLSIQGIDDELWNWAWTDKEPPTETVEEIAETLTRGAAVVASPKIDWGAASGRERGEWFVTRGAIAGRGRHVYTHAWHYLYQPYGGGVPDPVTPLKGSILTRWPCILRYSIESGEWEKFWVPLQEDGSVETPKVPDPEHLWIHSNGSTAWSLVPGERRLLTMDSEGKAEVGDKLIPPGQIFFYQDQPYLLPDQEEPTRLLNLVDDTYIDFRTLPTGVPGVQGQMAIFPGNQALKIEEAGSNDISPEGAMEIPGYAERMVIPDYLLSYHFTSKPLTDGKDLYAVLEVESEGVDSPYEAFDKELVKERELNSGKVLARYDGVRWHILPHGLRAFLESKRTAPPSGTGPQPPPPGNDLLVLQGMDSAVVARYQSLPKPQARYAIISIDTDPYQVTSDAP